MEIEKRDTSYLVFFQQGKNIQRTPITGVSDNQEIVKLLLQTFKGRFKCPPTLQPRNGVKIVVKCLDHIRHQTTQVFNARVYNKSVTQARQMFEMAVK